jgi:hypothetical protein
VPESKLAGGRGWPGDSPRFAAVTVETAEALRRDAERLLTEMLTGPSRHLTGLGVDLLLYNGNLISGGVSGLDWAWW